MPIPYPEIMAQQTLPAFGAVANEVIDPVDTFRFSTAPFDQMLAFVRVVAHLVITAACILFKVEV